MINLPGDGLVWKVDDAEALRTRYRLVGTAVGAVPGVPQQNICRALPILLSPEEKGVGIESGILTNPTTTSPAARGSKAIVFSDLWRMGFFVTSGLSTYGVDFLVYPREPLTSHAELMVIVRDFDDSLDVNDLIASVRVANACNKTFVVASVIPPKNVNSNDELQVRYASVVRRKPSSVAGSTR